ncbi:ATP-dependent RNA helicase RhlB [Exilibacterium tricleocarpae]|uniref:ATP-dependent RNA helicase RhlB n=1 Tax=Exilibacterium tricleocarpae TaxID=2591008 RepID=A0A545TSN3_9GAMM|nr:ATP-dependent RNA helicase RhlB [Exilibacterium tricleocarpae]TQV80151.1 ATP-dependent RNA helicase RhlB [Exilibacterium tricleocarpae]
MIGKLFSSNRDKNADSAPAQQKPASQKPAQQQPATVAKKASGKSQHPQGGKRRNQRRRNTPGTEDKDWHLGLFPVPEVPGKTRFHDLDLPAELMHAIADQRFEYCSPIQAQSLPHSLNGHDLVGKAQTGTGKTAAFLVTIIDDLLKHPLQEDRFAGEARALIIAPTRELAMQIADDSRVLTKYTGLETHVLVGGMDYAKQQRRLQDTLVDILVATPGRLLDFCGNKDVYLDQLEVLVIDEADRMLDMGFIPQVRRIIRQTPRKSHRQTLLFSATITPDVVNLAEQWTEDAVTVEIEPQSVATDTVEQHVYLSTTEEKYTLLYNILNQEDVDSLIVFANRRDECRRLHEKLERHGFKAGLLSGEIAQNRRVKTLNAFKSGELKVLVATDVAGRGIHIDGISHVVNFTLPEEPEDYVHRIGRTGRAGKSGTSISFACEDDAFRLMPIQELLGQKLKCVQPPLELLAELPPMGPRRRAPGDDRERDGRDRNRRGRGRHSNR